MSGLSNAQRVDLERRIVRGLIRAMRKAGWEVFRVNDGESLKYVTTEEQAMARIFAVDEASLRFVPVGQRKQGNEHGVLLVLGNGEDVISDWNYFDGDRDGFNKAVSAYAYREFA